jgi:hypothetical protein
MPHKIVPGVNWDFPRNYSLTAVNRSAAALSRSHEGLWRLRAERLSRRHDEARAQCSHQLRGDDARDDTSVTSTGGWCLRTAGQRLVSLPNNRSYRLPPDHVPADARILVHLSALLSARRGGARLSALDLGAGVGQFGHGLLSLDPGVRYVGYDGAGNVEEATDGFLHFVDLTIPLALRRADWVVSLEVGEHVPHGLEGAFVRNVHALNCRGVLLSWGYAAWARGHAIGLAGTHHINNHANQYVVHLFEELGYRFDVRATQHLRRGRQKGSSSSVGDEPALAKRGFGADMNGNHDWFRATVMVFERWTPLQGEGCTPLTDGIARTSSFPILPEAPTRDIRREGGATAFFKGGALLANKL